MMIKVDISPKIKKKIVSNDIKVITTHGKGSD